SCLFCPCSHRNCCRERRLRWHPFDSIVIEGGVEDGSRRVCRIIESRARAHPPAAAQPRTTPRADPSAPADSAGGRATGDAAISHGRKPAIVECPTASIATAAARAAIMAARGCVAAAATRAAEGIVRQKHAVYNHVGPKAA